MFLILSDEECAIVDTLCIAPSLIELLSDAALTNVGLSLAALASIKGNFLV